MNTYTDRQHAYARTQQQAVVKQLQLPGGCSLFLLLCFGLPHTLVLIFRWFPVLTLFQIYVALLFIWLILVLKCLPRTAGAGGHAIYFFSCSLSIYIQQFFSLFLSFSLFYRKCIMSCLRSRIKNIEL